MSNSRTLILIWGGAILFYLAVSNANGTKTFLGALESLISGPTKVLQARA